MKRIFYFAAVFAMLNLATTSCTKEEDDDKEKTENTDNGNNQNSDGKEDGGKTDGGDNNNDNNGDNGDNNGGNGGVVEADIDFSFDGEIDVTEGGWQPGQKCTITFSGFPQTLEGLKKAQEKIGGRAEGAVLLQLFAFELYGHNYTTDKALGEECVKLVNVENNYTSVFSIIQDKYNPKYQDTYMPYLVASYVKGASANNAYKATKPFQITIQSSYASAPQDVSLAKGTNIYLQVLCYGTDQEGGSWRGCEVMKQKGSPYYKVFNCPGMYLGVLPVSFKIDDEYVDICKQ